MSRRTTIIGLAALCALVLGAIGTPGAFAGVTAFTCLPEAEAEAGMTKGTDSYCETARNEEAVNGMKAFSIPTAMGLRTVTPPVFTGKIFGATVQLKATGASTCIECGIENKEVEVAGKKTMEVTGSGGKVEFIGIEVVGAEAKCTVIGSGVGKITTKPLKFTTTSMAGVTLEPQTGTLLAEFSITGSECGVKGVGLQVTGKATGALDGGKLTLNVTKASEELKLEGEKASLTGVAVIVGEIANPLALTTTSP